jgi:hypothetical protein
MNRLVLLLLVVGCSSPPPPQTAANSCPATPEPRCKTAVEKAATITKIRDREVTMEIGECEQHEWPMQARQCIVDAHAPADLTACGAKFSLGKKGIFADGSTMDKAMKQMKLYRDQFCACKDSACAQKVSDDMTKWGQEMAKDDVEPPKMSEEETKEFTAIGEEMGKCMQKAMGGTP